MKNGIVTGLDLETTGLDFNKGDRIVEACLSVYRVSDGVFNHLKTVTQRINPERSIPLEAQRVHGISLEDLVEMPKWVDFAGTAKRILEASDLVVIHNAGFDQPFIEGEMRRVGMPLSRPLPAFCTMENGRWSTFDGKNPSLKELCWSLGVEYDPSLAHDAAYDVGVMMECYQKGVSLGLFKE